MNSSNQLPGIWQALSVIVGGEAIPADDVNEIRLTLTATRFTTSRGAETLFDSTYTSDATTCPKRIEMIGTGGDFEGQPALGIYAFEGEILQLCYTMPGFQRPADFTSGRGSGAFLITLKRLE
ncbi:MAG TPA: TIGR03067 domain-containing protein [Verrucomicrobiae bacterium]|nr:TIGR03067 domain-containing protein [Verrucomicrobiae bacterium]